MERLKIPLAEVFLCKDLRYPLDKLLRTKKDTLLITDTNVHDLYLTSYPHRKIVIPAGEEQKTLATVEEILSYMARERLKRDSLVLALGGGVIGDIAGFCASIYMRGISYYQIPTTLIAQCDSCLGGKTGVNLPLGKNLVGTFYHPKQIWICPFVLTTLPRRERISGLGEMVKYGIILDSVFLHYLIENLPSLIDLHLPCIEKAVLRCLELKSFIVSKDTVETGLRKTLNFGHSIGHALESATSYLVFRHGEAVILGMRMEARLACSLNLLKKEEYQVINELLAKLPVPKVKGLDLSLVREALHQDKKNQGETLSFFLPTGLGKGKEVQLPPRTLDMYWKEVTHALI